MMKRISQARHGNGMTSRLLIAFCLGAWCVSAGGSIAFPSPSPRQAATLESKGKAIEALVSRRHMAADILRDLTTALPGRVWLTEVVCDSATVQVKGNAPSNNLVADYISRLGTSSCLAEVNLVSSVQRSGWNGTHQEFAVGAAVRLPPAEKLHEPGSPAGRMQEFEKIMPAQKDPAGALRQLQEAANEAGLSITKLAPGADIPREFYVEWAIAIEVTGSRRDLLQFFEALSDLPRLWIVAKFSFRTISAEESNSLVRGSLAVSMYRCPT